MPKLHFPLMPVVWQEKVADDIFHPSTDLTSLYDSTPPLSHSLFIIARRGKWAFVIITQGESWMVVVQPRKELYFGEEKNLLLLSFLGVERRKGATTGNESEHGEYGKRIREPGFVNWVHIALLFSHSMSSLNQEFALGDVVNRCGGTM